MIDPPPGCNPKILRFASHVAEMMSTRATNDPPDHHNFLRFKNEFERDHLATPAESEFVMSVIRRRCGV